MVQRPTIPHLKALVVDNRILGWLGLGSLKGLPGPCSLKSKLFTNNGHGKPLVMPRPCPSRAQSADQTPNGKGYTSDSFAVAGQFEIVKKFIQNIWGIKKGKKLLPPFQNSNIISFPKSLAYHFEINSKESSIFIYFHNFEKIVLLSWQVSLTYIQSVFLFENITSETDRM